MDEEEWKESADANGEIIARKLKKLGLLDSKDGYYIRTPMYEALTEPSDLMSHEEAWEQIESDLISRAELIEAIEDTDWYHINRNGEMVHGSNDEHESWYKYDDIYKAIDRVPSVSVESKATENKYDCDLISRAELKDKWCEYLNRAVGHFPITPADITAIIDGVPSVSANSDDLIIKNGKGIQDGLYNIKDGEIFKYKAKGGTVRAYKLVPSVSAEREYWRGYNDGHTPYARLGEWIFNGYADENKSWFICSECDHSQFHKSNYCPNCGARMKGADNV